MTRARGRAGPMRPFERSLPMQLMRAREIVMARFRPHLHAHGLTDQQWRIVRALNEVAELDMMELGARCCIHPASLSRILPRLEDEGLLRRRTSREDQRRVIVSLAPRGRQPFADVAPESEAIYAAITREIGTERLEAVYAVLDDVIRTLSGTSPQREAGKITGVPKNFAAKRAMPSAKRGR